MYYQVRDGMKTKPDRRLQTPDPLISLFTRTAVHWKDQQRFALVELLVLVIISGVFTMAKNAFAQPANNADGQPAITNSIQTLPIDKVFKNHRTTKHRTESPISLIAPVVVRQDDPHSPKYQEALGYTFLIERAGFPALTRMDDGKLVLTMRTEYGNRILFSEDEGMSWSRATAGSDRAVHTGESWRHQAHAAWQRRQPAVQR